MLHGFFLCDQHPWRAGEEAGGAQSGLCGIGESRITIKICPLNEIELKYKCRTLQP